MENTHAARGPAGLIQPLRRRLLLGALALMGCGAAARLFTLAPAGTGEGFVIIDGWVLPARYFRD